MFSNIVSMKDINVNNAIFTCVSMLRFKAEDFFHDIIKKIYKTLTNINLRSDLTVVERKLNVNSNLNLV